MNKINIYVLTFFLSLAGVSIYAQNNRSQVVITSGQDNNVFFHTIERGQTVYAIATMYGVTPDDIYRLNPDSKEGIKAGATLKIPQRDIVGGTAKKQIIFSIPYSPKKPCIRYPSDTPFPLPPS